MRGMGPIQLALSLVLLGLLCIFVQAEKGDYEKEEGIFVLTSKNYEQATKTDFKHLLVYFYAQWCGHCKAFGPELVKAAQLLREKDSDIKIGKVEGPEETKLLEQMHVTGYPTLFFYRDGVPLNYTGGRMANEIAGWLEKRVGPPAVELDSKETLDAFVDSSDVVVVGFFKDKEDAETKAFLDAIRDYEQYPVAICHEETVAKAMLAEDRDVVLFKKFDEGRAVYSGAIGKQQLFEFIDRYAVPMIVDFNHETAQKIFKGLVKAHFLLFVDKSEDRFKELEPVMRELAESFRFKVQFVVIDLQEDDNRRVVEFLGLKKETMPLVRIVQMKDAGIDKYKPDSDKLDQETLTKFVQDFLDDKVKIHYLSEELPEDWDKKPVKILTGKNFDEVVLDTSKDALVFFHAPWCGHCKHMAPVWDELAAKLADKEDVVVAKIDATTNEIPHSLVRSFPTIKLYAKKDNQQAEYNGERTLEGFIKFYETKGVYGQAAPDHDEL